MLEPVGRCLPWPFAVPAGPDVEQVLGALAASNLPALRLGQRLRRLGLSKAQAAVIVRALRAVHRELARTLVPHGEDGAPRQGASRRLVVLYEGLSVVFRGAGVVTTKDLADRLLEMGRGFEARLVAVLVAAGNDAAEARAAVRRVADRARRRRADVARLILEELTTADVRRLL